MSKYRLDNPANTSLDPFAFEKQFAQPNLNNPSPFSGVASSLEIVAPDKVDEGYGTMGNSSYALEAINEAKAANQGAGELLAKGLGNVVKTIGIEIAKTPGYLVGGVGAIGNELLGDGKDSMSYMVDNAYINAFEKLDQGIKDAMPIYMSKQIQEGGLMDKLGSGGWWAEAGADGVGFMLAMFAPGTALKALGVGAKIGQGMEALANVSGRLGKVATGESWVAKLGLMSVPENRIALAVEEKTAELMAKSGGVLDDVAKAEIAAVEESARAAAGNSFKYTKSLARNADGYASATINTVIESSAEAANTFDSLKTKYINEGLTEEEAKAKAGEGAAAVFKGNMALLAVSNLLDEAFIWKTIGSAGEKEAGKSILSKIFKDGKVDFDALNKLPKEFTRANVLKRTGLNFGKGIIKEGFFEEGSQTTLQQNIDEGKIAEGSNSFEKVGGDLLNVVSSYLDDFSNNTELHESIFLGGLLGGGASIFGTIQENNALRKALSGGEARTKDNSFWAKYGILPETKAQKGFNKIVSENHIAQFRSYKDLLEEQPDGSFKLNDQKLADANLEQADILRTNILYDLAVARGDKLGQQIYGQFLAANYTNGFVGQEGGKELFKDHVEQQVIPAWKNRYLETFGVEATEKQVREYADKFLDSGNRIFDAHKTAEETNYAERYYSEPTKEFQEFKNVYFQKKFQTLVALDAFKAEANVIQKAMFDSGVTEAELEDLSTIKDPIAKAKAQELKRRFDVLTGAQQNMNEEYAEFYTKEGVKKMFENFKGKNENFKDLNERLKEENEKLKAKVNQIPVDNAAEIQRITDESKGDSDITFRAVNGKRYTLNDLQNFKGDINSLKLQRDDVSDEEYENFEKTKQVSDKTLKSIAEKSANNEKLSNREEIIASENSEKIEQIIKAEQEKKNTTPAEPTASEGLSDEEYNKLDTEIDDANKKKGVNMFPSTGRNLKDDLVEKDGIFIEGMTDSPVQKLWFETLEKEVSKEPTEYTVKVVKYGERNSETPELRQQIEREALLGGAPKDSDTYVILHKNGKAIIKNGAYVFTALWRPETLHPTSKGKAVESRLAESAIIANFLLHLQKPKMKINRLSKTDKDTLKLNNVEPTEKGIREAAHLHARREYESWYNSLQSGNHLQTAGITKGHRVKAFKDKEGTIPFWGDPVKGLGLTITKNQIVGGKIQMSPASGVIKIEEDEFKINPGDVVLIDNENNIHPLKARNLNQEEIETVLYLLSLRDTVGPSESIMVSDTEDIVLGDIASKKAPVFFTKDKKTTPIISTLISFGSNEGKKGEIYFPLKPIELGKPLLVFTDFNGETQNVEVSLITEAINSGDFSKVDSLVKFLQEKRLNVNKLLLGDGKIVKASSKPRVKYGVDTNGKRTAELSWNHGFEYVPNLLSDVLTTTTQKFDGYPNRAQRNIFFNKQPIPSTVVEDKVEVAIPVAETVPVETPIVQESKPPLTAKERLAEKIRNKKSLDSFKDDMDKILTTTDLLKSKIKSGEIIQNCR